MVAIFNPFSREGYFGRLSEAFGWRYVLVVMITYGFNQGGLSYWGRQGRAFYFRDAPPQGIELGPDVALIVENFGKLPWDLKAVFGLLSDAFAINGYHRTPYTLAAAIFGFIGWGLLGVLDEPVSGLVTLLTVLGNISIAIPDVMIDATVAAKCRDNPIHAVDLQSLGWSSIYFTSIIFPLAFGPMYEGFQSAKPIFLVCLAFPPMLFFPVLFGWLSEEKDENPEESRHQFIDIMHNAITLGRYTPPELDDEFEGPEGGKVAIKDEETGMVTYTKREDYLKYGKLYLLALVISVLVIAAGTILSEFNGTPEITAPILVACVVSICTAMYFLMGPIATDLAFGAMYIFLRRALVPLGGSTLLFWNSDTSNPEDIYDDLKRPNDYNQCNETAPENFTTYFPNETWGQLNRPCLDNTFVTSIDSVGGAMGLIGIMMYNKFLSHWSYKQIFMLTAVLGFVFSFLDLIWVYRWNQLAGIPDEIMRTFGEEVVVEVLGNWDTVPMFVMAAKLCPRKFEGTLFALLMGLSNFGNTVASYSGSIIVNALTISQKDGFDNLPTWILIRNMSNLLVIFIVPLLVPTGSPQDKSIYEEDSVASDEEAIAAEERRTSLVEEKAKTEAARRTSLTPFNS